MILYGYNPFNAWAVYQRYTNACTHHLPSSDAILHAFWTACGSMLSVNRDWEQHEAFPLEKPFRETTGQPIMRSILPAFMAR